MPTILLIKSPNSTVSVEKSLVFSQDSVTVGRGGNDIRFAHEPEDRGISLTVLTLEDNSEKDGSINALYHGEEEAFLDGNKLSTGEVFLWSSQSLIINGRLGEYAFFLRNSKASWRFDLKAAKPNFCRILDKSDLAKPLLPGESVNFKIEVSDYKYDSNAPDDLWLQPSNIESPIRLELANLPVWNGHDGNPDEKLYKNAKRLHVPKPVNSIEPSFSLELPLLIPAGTKADRYTIELWVCSKVKGYQSLKVDLTVAPEYSFTSSFDPIGDVENYSKGVPYLKPGRSARLSITNSANIEQTLLLDWIVERSDKSGNSKIIRPLAGKTKTIERKLQRNGEPLIEVPALHWQSWLDRPWLLWPLKDEERVILKISSEKGNQVPQWHPFMFKKDKGKGTILFIFSVIFTLYFLVFPWMDRRFHPNMDQIGVLNNPYGAGTPVIIYVTNPTNIASVALIESETPIPLAIIGMTQGSESITNTYVLSTTKLTPSKPTQVVKLQISSNFNPLNAQPWIIDCDSWIALLFCTMAKREATIEFKQALDKCGIQLVGNEQAEKCNSPLKYLAKFDAQEGPEPKPRYSSLIFEISAIQTGIITVRDEVAQKAYNQTDNSVKIPLPIAFTSLDPAIDPVSFYTYTIAIDDNPIQTVSIIVTRPIVVTNKDNVQLDDDDFIGSQKLHSNIALLALSKPNSTNDGELIKVWYQSRYRWLNKNDVTSNFEIDTLPDQVVPPTPSNTPTFTPEPSNTPIPTFTETPTRVPAVEFNLVEPSIEYKNSSTLVTIYACACENTGNGMQPKEGYTLKVTKLDDNSQINSALSTTTFGRLPESLNKSMPMYNITVNQSFTAGKWRIQLYKDQYIVSPAIEIIIDADDKNDGLVSIFYLRYCRGSNCEATITNVPIAPTPSPSIRG